MPAPRRRAWAQRVLLQLEPHLANGPTVIVLAGQRYREHLAPALEERGCRVHVPMRGLSIGRQLAWLGAHTRRT